MKESTLTRRSFAGGLAAALSCNCIAPASGSTPVRTPPRKLGLLLGSLLGDALGGPLEFANEEKRKDHVVGARNWKPEQRLTPEVIEEIAGQLKLMSYESLRPDPAPYGPWKANAQAGTITDDSRWKVMLLRAIRRANREHAQLSQSHVGHAILDFQPLVDQMPDAATQGLLEEGLREYRFAANWVLGERDPTLALPLERLWSGIANCSGQMLLLPLAIGDAGAPEAAYRRSFELNFVDAAGAKDICSAIVAALASVLGEQADHLNHNQRWERFHVTLETLDPFHLKQVPFAGRPLDRWLQLVDSIVKEADGRPAVAYRLLETEARPVYYWDAHFTLVVALTLLKLCQYDAMCALALTLDFGHDTDSYAQLIGAFAGAIYGVDVFPAAMRESVEARLKSDFGEELDEWVSLLNSL